jgi:hypothetical protein
MSTTTTQPKSGVDVQGLFLKTGPRYKTNRKFVEAIIASKNPQQSMLDAQEVIDALKILAENGEGYTPPSNLNFGSDNASTIAQAVLGQRASTASIRSAFAKVGS